MSGYSARSNEDMNETLAAMFPEFEATNSLQISRSNRLAPYFKSVF